MIELQDLKKYFGENKAVEALSLTIHEGENLVLLGTSGCGKTTTLKMINRLIEPDSGRILIKGKNILEEKPEVLRRGIGYVMQNIGLFPHYSIAENIAIVPKLLKWPVEKTNQRIQELLEKLHLPQSCLNLFPHELSGGQQQRVGLARALVTDPDILLMDEPFGALDNVTRSSIQEEFKALEEFKRKTIVMVTHDVQEAFELGDRICLMDEGKVVQIGTPEQLLYQPENEFAKQFLDGQRLALEFKITKLSDLQPYFTNEVSSTSSPKPIANTSVWTAMESLRTSAKGALKFTMQDENVHTLDFEQLSHAFNQYQQNRRHE